MMNPNSIICSFTLEKDTTPKISNNIESLADIVRANIFNTQCYIAGGACMASLIPEYSTTDVDIFFPRIDPGFSIQKDWVYIDRSAPTQASHIGALSINYHVTINNILFDLVFMPSQQTIWDVFEQFDINLSKCAYDITHNTYIIDHLCWDNIIKRKITTGNVTEKTSERVKKYLRRLPGWTTDLNEPLNLGF